MRILGIDYGRRRVGLAVTDPLQLISTHLDTVSSTDLMSYLIDYCGREDVEGFVIGKPLNLRGELNEIYDDILLLKNKLSHQFPQKYIAEIDERFTSKIATQSILHSGVNKKKRQDKSLVDMVSAVVILQDYLTLKSNLK